MPGDVLTTSVSRARNSHPFSNPSPEATENQYWGIEPEYETLGFFETF